MKTLTVIAFLLVGCNEEPIEMGEIVKIEQKNSRTCNYYVVPVTHRQDTVIVQNHCERWNIGDVIGIE